MNDKLKSAESAIHFIQKEHERVLHGLHMEIERLQQKCSGLFTSTKMNPPVGRLTIFKVPQRARQ